MRLELKLIVVGAAGVGKSALTLRLVTGEFVADTDPKVQDSYRKQLVLDGETRRLDVLDTAGQEEFSSLQDEYFRTCDGALLVYSITSRPSFEELANLHDKVLRAQDKAAVPMLLVGNRCDLQTERQVPAAEAQALASGWAVPFLEASAKTGLNAEDAFAGLVREILRQG